MRTRFKNNINSPREFWSKIKQIYPNKERSSRSNVLKINGCFSNEKTISDFRTFFTNVSKSLKSIAASHRNKTRKFQSLDGPMLRINPKGKVFKFKKLE